MVFAIGLILKTECGCAFRDTKRLWVLFVVEKNKAADPLEIGLNDSGRVALTSHRVVDGIEERAAITLGHESNSLVELTYTQRDSAGFATTSLRFFSNKIVKTAKFRRFPCILALSQFLSELLIQQLIWQVQIILLFGGVRILI